MVDGQQRELESRDAAHVWDHQLDVLKSTVWAPREGEYGKVAADSRFGDVPVGCPKNLVDPTPVYDTVAVAARAVRGATRIWGGDNRLESRDRAVVNLGRNGLACGGVA